MRVACVVGGLVISSLGGCTPIGGGGAIVGGTSEAFAPASLRVHPLSHVEVGSRAAGPIIVLHIELKDRYGDTVKGLGRLQVLLYRQGEGEGPSEGGVQDLKWDVAQMSEPDANARLFDPATRTYRLQLDAPLWVGQATGWIKVRAVLAIETPEGDRLLSDEFVMQR